jgi:acyl-CoA synthetase (NDP forming)
VAALLDCYGIRIAPWRLVRTPGDAGAAAEAFGGLVALKAVVPGMTRKVEAGAVQLALEGAREVTEAAHAMGAHLAAAGRQVEGFLVQRMVAAGVEMLVGVVHDQLFGPVIACGAGGGEVSRLRDVGVRITPLTDRDACELVASLDAYVALTEPALGPPADVAALEDTLLRVSAMVEAHPEIIEMDLNPVIVLADRAVVVDARVRIEAPGNR